MPVRMGLDACDAARAGLAGLRNILEHPDGFLATFASVPMPDAVDLALGRRWHTETLSFEVRPGGPVLDAAVDCAADLHRVLGPVTVDAIDEVVVTTSMYTLIVDQKAAEFLDGERSPVSALVFSVLYAVATTLLTGGLTGADFARPATADEQRWRLAAKIRLEHDPEMTRQSLLSEAPFGEALRQAGPRAAKWLEEVGGHWLVDLAGELPAPNASFETATKMMPARVEVRLRTGETRAAERSIPAGAIGPDTRAHHHDIVRTKFLAVGGPEEAADIAANLATASAAQVREMLTLALR
jgi:2-methylcitrate dehydratase PrpD